MSCLISLFPRVEEAAIMSAAFPVPMSGRTQADATTPSAPVTPRKRICGGRVVDTTRIETCAPASGLSVRDVEAFTVRVTVSPDSSSPSVVTAISRCSEAASEAR